MIDNLLTEDRANLFKAVSETWYKFIELLETAALTVYSNSCSHSATSRTSRSATSTRTTAVLKFAVDLKTKTENFQADQRRSNVHVALHYVDQLNEYELMSNCNVLIDEDKHRWFKKIIYNINFSNVEKHLLSWENMQQTIRLTLLSAFLQDESAITSQLRHLFECCSTLFESLLLKFERQKDERDDDDSLLIQSDDHHSQTMMLHRLQLKYCREILDLSTRFSMLHQYSTLRLRLREIYEKDYNMKNIFEFDNSSILWCIKLSFNDRWAAFSSILLYDNLMYKC